MAIRLTNQPERLSYTRRDLELIDEEVNKFIKHFIPTIKNTGKANVGRLFLRILEALVDKLNYSLDMRYRQSVLRTVTELQAALDITEIVRFKPTGVASSQADLDISTLTGPAPAGGISIPQYSIFSTDTSPVKQFIALEAVDVPEGATSFTPLQVVQGIRVVDQVIQASASGEENESVIMPVSYTPHSHVEIKVDGAVFEQQVDLKDSESVDTHYYLKDNEDSFTSVIFGDGTYGTKLTPGAVVTATYLQSLGEDGNTPATKIVKVVGSLSSLIAVTNEEAATGGYDGDIVEDIVRDAPKQASTFWRASNDRDFEALAETLVEGVHQALASAGTGTVMDLYIMPTGGGVAPSALLTSVEEVINPRMIHGAVVNAKALEPAHIWIKMDVLLLSNRVKKALARRRIYEAFAAFKLNGEVNSDGALYFRNLTIGRGFALSDAARIVEAIDSDELVDYVDFKIFTRYPTPVVVSVGTTVEFQGEIVPTSVADYDEWSLIAVSTTEFYLYKNSVLDSQGTIGVQHTSADGSIIFTLGTSTDTFNAGDTWTFETSAYRNNMKLSEFEFMELARDSDLDITVYYPGELEIGG